MIFNNKNILFVLSILPVVVYALMIDIYATNIPWFDDIEVFPEFILKYNQLSNWMDKFELIFRPNNEHRVVFAKVITLFDYYINDNLNLRRLQIYCNLSMLGFVIIFWKIVKSYHFSISYFIPIPFLLLHPQYYLLSLWTITGFQSICVLFIGFWGMYCLAKNSLKWYLFAIILILVASFTMSNGMFFWIAGLLVLVLQGHLKRIIGWILLAGLVIKLYFYHFDTSANSTGFTYFFLHPYESFYGFFVHLGGHLDFFNSFPIQKRTILPFVAGLSLFVFGLLCFFGILLFSKTKVFGISFNFHNKYLCKIFANFNRSPLHLAVFGVWIFLIINAIVIALLRTRFGMEVLIIGNYRIYPVFLGVISYLMLIIGWQISKRKLFYLTVLSIIFWGCSYLKFLPEAHERSKDLLVRAYNQEYNSIGLGPYEGSDYQKIVKNIFSELTTQGIYKYPESIFRNHSLSITEKTKLPVSITKELLFENKTLPASVKKNDGAYLVLKSNKHQYIIYEKRRLHNFLKTGFSIQLPPKYVTPDNYSVRVLWVKNGIFKIFDTNQSIKINH